MLRYIEYLKSLGISENSGKDFSIKNDVYPNKEIFPDKRTREKTNGSDKKRSRSRGTRHNKRLSRSPKKSRKYE